jgi:Polyphosphate kinase 2 (PPK2)
MSQQASDGGPREPQGSLLRLPSDGIRPPPPEGMAVKPPSFTARFRFIEQASINRQNPLAWPWYIVPADDKRRARLKLIRHLLDSIPYEKVDIDLPMIPKAQPRPENATEGLGRAGQPIPSHY